MVRAMRSGQYRGEPADAVRRRRRSTTASTRSAIPFFFKNDAETKAVQDGADAALEKRIAAKGFHLLAWTNGGWVQLFSKKPLKTLDDIKKANLWTSDGDMKMVQWYKTNGFQPVADGRERRRRRR